MLVSRRRNPSAVIAAIAFAVLAFLAFGAGVANGHALLESASPAPNTAVATSPSTVTLKFTETPDPTLSSVQVLDSSGQVRSIGAAALVDGHPDELTVTVQSLPNGVYTVSWRTISSIDGHATAGSYAFSVGTAPPPVAPASGSGPSGAAQGSAGASPDVVLARWLLYVGLLGLLGAGFLGAVLLPRSERASPLAVRLANVELIVAAAGTVLLVGAQLGDSGASFSALAGSTLGRDVVLRLVPLLVAAVFVAVATFSPPAGLLRRSMLGGVAAMAAAALLVEAATSHAASGGLPAAEIAIQWLHLVAVGLWLGGLVALLLSIRGGESVGKAALARRFALLAAFGIGLVALTGLLRAAVEVGTVGALFSTDFGRLVLVKVILLLPLAGLGALNHFRNVPLAGRRLAPLRRTASVELVLGVTLLLVAAQLVNIAPPAEVSAANAAASQPSAASAPLLVTGADFGTSVRLTLGLSPGTVGQNAFRAELTDYDTGKPVAATAVQLRFALPARPDVGRSTLELTRQADGTFAATGANLSLEGTWYVAATVTEPATSVEVDLSVPVKPAPQQIDVIRTPGAPTIYTVHFVGDQTVQVYLDPGKAGSNVLHLTWFGADGNEIPVSDVSVAQVLGSDSTKSLEVQVLDPGHETASATVPALPVTFRISATGPGAAQLSTQLEIDSGS